MANNINWGKIYESTYWGNTDNNISWGKVYADLAGVVPALVSEFVSRVEADGGSVESTECLSTDLTFLVQNPEPVAFTGLLNDYSGAAAAYSLRLLDNTYTGDAIVVRRASDNTTQAIGFVNNELDTTSLESFCSGTDGFVATWYDQSGSGNDAAQGTASKQPKIVSSGSTILEGGKAALSFTNSPYLVSAFSSPISTTTGSIVFKGLNNNFIFDSKDSVNKNSLVLMPDGFNFRLFFGNGSPISVLHSIAPDVWGNRHLGSFISDGANSTLGIDGSFTATSSTSSVTMNGITLGSAATGLIPLQGTIQEAVIYGSNQSANLSGIETNINDFYTIY